MNRYEENIEQNYWLFIHSYVYLSVKKYNAIIYNTLNHKFIEIDKNSPVFNLVKRLNSDTNLYVIKIRRREITPKVKEFIRKLRNEYFGDIIDLEFSKLKPIQSKPILNLQKTLYYLTIYNDEKTKILVVDNIPDYLDVVTIYINNDCNHVCSICHDGYKQFLCCHKSFGKKNQINIKDLSILVSQIKKSNIFKFNIIGGNIFSNQTLLEFVKNMNVMQFKKNYYIHYLNIVDNSAFFKLLMEGNNKLHVNIHFPLNLNTFYNKMKILIKAKIKSFLFFNFVIQSEKDIDAAELIISKFQVDEFHYTPYFNGKNIDFFKKHVFLSRESIFESQPDLKDIFMQQIINNNDFKKLTIFSDKLIYANLNNPKIGILGKNNIFDLIYKELHNGKSWTKVRKNVIPCKSCVFNALCPPISNYEYAIGRYNLCNIM